jgi:hypothetical protein
MERAVETRVQVAQQDVDSAKRGEIIEVTPTGYHSNVATACCDDRAEEGETAIQPPSTLKGADLRSFVGDQVRGSRAVTRCGDLQCL